VAVGVGVWVCGGVGVRVRVGVAVGAGVRVGVGVGVGEGLGVGERVVAGTGEQPASRLMSRTAVGIVGPLANCAASGLCLRF
jgi:hypothetical protein